ncbi:TPA: hypothetical protein EYP26_00470 [Candidatus Bathyarchaeota archaeon]|nr:hypothetical protein [Candidatus Bathyarchaeota archaeon]
MKRTVAIHSYKGGTGKTSIAVNLAILSAAKGRSVCLMDYDFRAPSAQVAFKEKPRLWLNDFLNGRCELKDALVDLTEKYGVEGRLLVGFANPDHQALKSMMAKDRRWEMRALHRTLSAKRIVHEGMGVDLLIFDTSPGMIYSSINALASSDLILIVMKGDVFDLEGTIELVRGTYDILGRKAQIILNKIPLGHFKAGGAEALQASIQEKLGLPVVGLIPCDCGLLADGGKSIYAIEKPSHPFVQALSKMAEKIFA